MIERYAMQPLKDLWNEENQYKRWLEVEVSVVKAFEKYGQAPVGTSQHILSKAVIDVQKIHEIEAVVDHDVIAFINCVTQKMGDEARYFHKGMTSSDVVDTALSLALKRSGLVIKQELETFEEVLKEQAFKYKDTITIGRTHGIHAEPTSFGLKLLSYLAEVQRNKVRLDAAIENISYAKISGAVGNYANIDPEIESLALQMIGLKPCKVSTQIVPRDIHAEFLNTLALIGANIERLATEIRHLQKTEVLEVQEPFKKGQRGSSAMPHKKNPILCERLCGMSRMLRSYTIAGYEDTVLWHERDISHSSVERMVFPDATMITYYMINKSVWLVKNLVVYENKMKENFKASHNLVFSQRLMLAMIDKGFSREESYKLIQELSMRSWNESIDLMQVVLNDERTSSKFNENEIKEIFDPAYYLRNIEEVFKRFI